MPANTKDSATAGPAFAPAASPVSTKMPVPITTPTPKTVSCSGAELLAQLVLRLLRVRDRLLDGLGAEQVHGTSRRSLGIERNSYLLTGPVKSKHRAYRVGLLGGLVVAVAEHPREPQRHAGRVARRGLDAVEGDLDDLLRAAR